MKHLTILLLELGPENEKGNMLHGAFQTNMLHGASQTNLWSCLLPIYCNRCSAWRKRSRLCIPLQHHSQKIQLLHMKTCNYQLSNSSAANIFLLIDFYCFYLDSLIKTCQWGSAFIGFRLEWTAMAIIFTTSASEKTLSAFCRHDRNGFHLSPEEQSIEGCKIPDKNITITQTCQKKWRIEPSFLGTAWRIPQNCSETLWTWPNMKETWWLLPYPFAILTPALFSSKLAYACLKYPSPFTKG